MVDPLGNGEGLVSDHQKQGLQQMPMLLKISVDFSKCPKPFTGIEEHCLGEVFEGRSRLSKCNGKLIMDIFWFKVKKQLKRERVCIV